MLNDLIKSPIHIIFWYIGGVCLAIAATLFIIEIFKTKKESKNLKIDALLFLA